MDVQGSQYHLLNGVADFGRCHDATSVVGSGLTLSELWADVATGLPSHAATDWKFDTTLRALQLRRETPLFQRARRRDLLTPESRRGADMDVYGNWFWIETDQRGIHTQSRGTRTGSAWWSVDDLATTCGCPAGSDAFSCTCPDEPVEMTLRGLCVTTHHYVLAGYRTWRGGTVAEAGLLVFDLQAGGPPLRMTWPDPAAFDPWDLSDTADGGALVLDRTHGEYWHLDEHLRLHGTVPEHPIAFTPVDGGAPVQLSSPAQPTPYALVDKLGKAIHPISIEPGPTGSVLVLDADPSRGYSVLSCFDGPTQRWQRPLEDVVEVIDETDPSNVPQVYSLLAHDFVYEVSGGPLATPMLYLADAEGDQVIAFSLDPATGGLRTRAEFLPMRRWGTRALVRTPDGVWYDFDPGAGDDARTRWVPLAVFTECRFAPTATFTTAAAFGDVPGLVGDTFDSQAPGCVWHRLMLDAHRPTGTSIRIRARAADDPTLLQQETWLPQPAPYQRSDGSELPWADPWSDVRGDVRDPQPLPDGMGTHELLFQGVTGRYLQLEVTFAGGGRATPLLRSLRAWFARFSYVDHYLPAIYGENDGPNHFLERFLANFEGMYTTLEEKIEHSHLILDARTARGIDLPWLAAWFALTLDPLWDESRRRFLIRHLDRFYRMRGTVRGLVATLRVYLDPLVDEGVFCSNAGAGGVRIVERFLTRDTGGAQYGAPAGLLDPDPLDRARGAASRFDVLVPIGLSADDRSMVARIVENAKPAHTAYLLRPYYELFVIGQARLGIDTEVGPAPVFEPIVPGSASAHLASGYLGYPRPFDLPDRVVSDRDRVGALPAL